MSESAPVANTSTSDMPNDRLRVAVGFLVSGRVQGVGFRPFVARLATALNLAGWVQNTPEGVLIHVEGLGEQLAHFRDRLEHEIPSAAVLLAINAEPRAVEGLSAFSIRPSTTVVSQADDGSSASGRVLITPDLAVCPACIAEFDDPDDRRAGFALSGCTGCGPRFSIQVSSPFDRERTTMVDFAPCPDCQREYADPADRRFHAQNIACPRCGPRIWLEPTAEPDAILNSVPDPPDINDLTALEEAAELLRGGAILAVKGIGGFHLLCDATSHAVVQRLRERKKRDRKPFAVLFLDLDHLAHHAEIDTAARESLLDAAAPIVLLRQRADSSLAEAVSCGLSTVGAFLAYTPLHRALVRKVDRPLVATSGNATDEPMPVDNAAARAELGMIADGFLLHNRRILRHADDCVVRVIAGRAVPVRIGRGLAPVRLELPIELPPLLATGGHLKAAIAVSRGRELFLGQHIGDLDTPSARRRYLQNIDDLTRLFGIEPRAIVHDAHPNYFTTAYAEGRGLPRLAVQHHHAHVMACLAEHGERGPALGIAWDGTGYGDDGTIWGGEFLIVDRATYRRVGSLWPFSLIGGDRAARQPRYSAACVCFAAGEPFPGNAGFTPAEQALLLSALNSPRSAVVTTSAGRLFDAWASLLGVAHQSAFEAEAAMRLEDLADPAELSVFDVEVGPGPRKEPGLSWCLDWRPWVSETLRRLARGDRPAEIAGCFHNSLANGSLIIARHAGVETVVLSGGCFQNRLLAERVSSLLSGDGFRVLTHRQVPPGDGGLAAGQLWAAALKLIST
ncbi:MAG TPA: carbamoyltransferase HypF [Isosphaeraceae bacterium]|nr:carbamoyltransferase HypF [Isosphaeraceae bacterium]